MGDEFRIPPSQRKEPKRFEPPPWERDAFEEIRRRQADHEADTELAEAVSALEQDVAEGEKGVEAAAEKAGAPVPAAVAQPVAVEDVEARAAHEQRMTEMLLELAATEKQSHRSFDKLNLVLMAVTAAIGVVLVVWGAAALSRAKVIGQVGLLGGLGLMFFGALFFGVAAWMAVRQLRQQGVL